MSWDKYDHRVPADAVGADDMYVPMDPEDGPLIDEDSLSEPPTEDATWLPDEVVELAEDAMGWVADTFIGTPDPTEAPAEGPPQ